MTAGELRRRVGFEIELLAPPGSSRKALAAELARRYGGCVRPVWHMDSERVPLPAIGDRFLHLTQGFEVSRDTGEVVATLVDDITISAELDPRAPAPSGWHRVLTDDPRLLRLLARACDPAGPLDTALDPVAALWGEPVERTGSVWRLESAGATVALAAPLGGERERPCEIITPPWTDRHGERLQELLEPSRALGFTVPAEAAVHLHVDGGPFRTGPAVANLIRMFGDWREPLRRLLATNPNCRRLAPLPADLVTTAHNTEDLAELRAVAHQTGLGKFFDVNLTALLTDQPQRDTVEIRVLPGSLDPCDIMQRSRIIERVLDRCQARQPVPSPPRTLGADEALRQLIAVASDSGGDDHGSSNWRSHRCGSSR